MKNIFNIFHHKDGKLKEKKKKDSQINKINLNEFLVMEKDEFNNNIILPKDLKPHPKPKEDPEIPTPMILCNTNKKDYENLSDNEDFKDNYLNKSRKQMKSIKIKNNLNQKCKDSNFINNKSKKPSIFLKAVKKILNEEENESNKNIENINNIRNTISTSKTPLILNILEYTIVNNINRFSSASKQNDISLTKTKSTIL